MTTGPLPTRFMGASPLVLALAGIFLGCLLDAMIKHLGASYTAILIAFGRYAFGTLFSGAAVLALKKKLPDGAGLRRHAVRAVASTASAVLFFHALTVLPIAEATVLIFVAPLMIAGATDGRFLMNAGIPTYGLSGMFAKSGETNAHGLNEKLRVQSLYEGRDFLEAVVRAYVK